MTLRAPPGFQGSFSTDRSTRREYGTASGPVALPPAAAAVPRDADDVVRLVDWSRREGLALVPRGAGTGMPGGNVGPGVTVDLSGLDALEPVDPEGRSVWVGPGVVADRVDAAAREHGLRFPPLPSSSHRCTLGGMAANNAAGARSFLHGSVREWIDAAEVVLPDGSLHRVGPDRPPPPAFSDLADDLAGVWPSIRDGWPRVRKNSSGYALDRFLPDGDPVQLLVGSEGTLGFLTRLRLRLVPEAEHRGVLLLALPEVDDLPAAVGTVREAGAVACEYLGRRILEMAGLPDDPEFGPLARGADALLLVEAEGSGERVDSALEAVSRLARELGAESREAREPEARERLWELRHRASPTIEEAAERGLRSMQFIEDCVVPVESLPDWVRGLGSILEGARTDAVVFGHAGDGNLHVNPLVDVEAPDWKVRVRTILDETAALIAELGGTLSGEHGDGRIRAPLLDRIWSDDQVAGFRRVKDTLDPQGRLNPGVILPLPGQDPLEGLGAGTGP